MASRRRGPTSRSRSRDSPLLARTRSSPPHQAVRLLPRTTRRGWAALARRLDGRRRRRAAPQTVGSAWRMWGGVGSAGRAHLLRARWHGRVRRVGRHASGAHGNVSQPGAASHPASPQRGSALCAPSQPRRMSREGASHLRQAGTVRPRFTRRAHHRSRGRLRSAPMLRKRAKWTCPAHVVVTVPGCPLLSNGPGTATCARRGGRLGS